MYFYATKHLSCHLGRLYGVNQCILKLVSDLEAPKLELINSVPLKTADRGNEYCKSFCGWSTTFWKRNASKEGAHRERGMSGNVFVARLFRTSLGMVMWEEKFSIQDPLQYTFAEFARNLSASSTLFGRYVRHIRLQCYFDLLVPLKCSSRNLQFSHGLPFTKEKMHCVPFPLKKRIIQACNFND